MSDESFDESLPAKVSDQSKIATPPTLMVDENLMRLAREYPRDENQISTRLNRELEANPSYADEMFYSIPYKDNRKGVINFVEGPSIRAAEHIWSRWGNCTVAARIADDRGSKIMIQGMFLDHENGLRLFSDMEVEKMGTARGGGKYPLSQNDLRIKVAATESKAKRNAFLSAIPGWIRDGYVNLCFDLSMGQSKKTIPDRIIDAKVFFMKNYKLDDETVLNLIERIRRSYPSIDDKSVLRYMIGLKNALRDGNADASFVFGEEKKQTSMPQEKKKEASHDDKTKTNTTAPIAQPVGDAQEE